MANEVAGVRRIGILLFPDVEELDAVGPWEVLSYWTRTYAEDTWSGCGPNGELSR